MSSARTEVSDKLGASFVLLDFVCLVFSSNQLRAIQLVFDVPCIFSFEMTAEPEWGGGW